MYCLFILCIAFSLVVNFYRLNCAHASILFFMKTKSVLLLIQVQTINSSAVHVVDFMGNLLDWTRSIHLNHVFVQYR